MTDASKGRASLQALMVATALMMAGCVGTTPSASGQSRGPDCAAVSEETREPESSAEDVREIPPRMKGGRDALYETLQYPEEAQRVGAEATLLMALTIDRRGRPFDLDLLRFNFRLRDRTRVEPRAASAARRALRQEAYRAVRRLRFEPGRQGGEPVCVEMTTPIRWRLN